MTAFDRRTLLQGALSLGAAGLLPGWATAASGQRSPPALSGEEIRDLLEKGVAPNRDENNFPNAGPSVSVPVTPVSDGTDIEVPAPAPAATSVPTVH